MTQTPARPRPVTPPRLRAARRSARAVTALLRRDAGERRLLKTSFLLDFAFGITNLLLFALISRFLHNPRQPGLGGAASYFDYVAVGIIFMLVVQAACFQITSRVQEEQRSGTLELLVAESFGAPTLAVGLSASPMLSAVLRSAAYLGLAGALLGLHTGDASWPGVAVLLVLGGTSVMALGICVAAYAVAFAHGVSAARLLVVALMFVSGTYFPVAALPLPVQAISQVLPTRIALDGLRSALAGGAWAESALLLAVTTAVCLPAATWLFGRAVHRATRTGDLTRG